MSNVIFNNKNYSIDDSAFAPHSNALKQHFSGVMNGSGAAINFGGTVYNIDSAKLATAKNALVSHLGTISGNGYKVVIGGVEYGVDSGKVVKAVAEIEAVLGGAISGGNGGSSGGSEPTGFPIAWNTIEVMNNLSVADGEVVKVSDFAPTYEQLVNTKLCVQTQSACAYEIGTYDSGAVVVKYNPDNITLTCVSIPVDGGEWSGVIFPEAGLYTMNYGLMGENHDFVIELIEYDPVFANNDWSTIAHACQNNAVPETWAVGDVKTTSINGSDVEIMIIGKNHDEYADGGVAPLTFMTKQIVGKHVINYSQTNVGGWDGSEMYEYLNNEPNGVIMTLSADVHDAIKPVVKTTTIGNKSSKTEASNDKLFLLSDVEVSGRTDAPYNLEGSQYDYFANDGSKILYDLNGVNDNWWLRSPVVDNTKEFRRVYNNGYLASMYSSGQNGVAFAFCF